jgi:uncharacterized membrane protein HdeD (DUF308 family)
MSSDALRQLYDRVRWVLVLRGVIGLAIGLFIFLRPFVSVVAFALVIAIWALVSGIAQVVHALDVRRSAPHWWVLLVGGLISFGFGAAALYYYPALSLTFAVIWTAYWLLLTGFAGIYAGIMERRLGIPWVWTIAFGVLGVLAGAYALVVPAVTLTVIIYVIAAYAIVGGILQIAAAFAIGAAHARLGGTPVGAARI